ncbi:distal tail protein Dit [Paenibacillus glucanolyticus]|uniref:distal tail protein Dit n=1 Tax=Paenibacillus glucanolyticus TaxID=59843 RepID=UPI0036AEBC8E
MQRATFVNTRGESVVFGTFEPFVLESIEGTGAPPLDIKSTKSPYQDGSSFISAQFTDREISITGFIKSNRQQEMYELRRELVKVLNPKLGPGKLVYSNDARSYAISAIAEESPVFNDRHVANQMFSINFVANDPYWRDENQTVQGLRFESGGMTFPLRLPTQFAFSAYRGTFTNSGDEATPVEIRYQGPATNTFFQLQPGPNILKYGSDKDSDQQAATVTVYWNNRYVGG